ncbi:MAG: hypothetical protein J2P31_07615 [Blastocatellia bacterium]|nr:hypothetical protein [Blastocatellia bacterium]
MLRITMINQETATRFVLEGKLAGQWVAELEKCWQAALEADQDCPSILVDLTAVSFVDAAGKDLLTRMQRKGSELLVNGLLTRAIFDSTDINI